MSTPDQSLFARLLHVLGRRGTEQTLRQSIAELVEEAAVSPEGSDEAPELDRQERLLIANILRLRGTMANDVMIPRADIVALRADLTLDETLHRLREEQHSRLPIYRDQLDDIIGMVHIKDVFAYIGRPEEFSLEKLLRRPLMVAPQAPVLDLLVQMRQARVHLALVVDEYGGIDGLVTIEDLVETIVGDIADEHDEVEGPLVTERQDGTLDVAARCSIEDFEERLGPVLTPEERASSIDTVGGLVFTLAGRVPARNEIITHPHSGMEFQVLDADPRHILKVRVWPPPPKGETEGAAAAA
ncbi:MULTISPECIES: hemolysin family protein [unclassified Acidisoma]|jgi:magnesium and cobalt transporter|uniref:hemolysin family protein n=1 Tax=unclassified Acidisoma TaxID=2634065 RepID=UPI00131B961A|nr:MULTISPECIES: hemolysin family protein [unclassified Acidisoma]